VYRAYKAKGVDFVGIDFKDQRGKAESFVKDNDISFPIVYDQQGKTALQMGHLPAQGLPFTVLIDKQQRVAAVYTGDPLTPMDLEPVLNKQLAEPAASSSSSAGPGA
jgi:peroxiredoxin